MEEHLILSSFYFFLFFSFVFSFFFYFVFGLIGEEIAFEKNFRDELEFVEFVLHFF